MPSLVIEFWYDDGDCGAYVEHSLTQEEQDSMRRLWKGFTDPHSKHKPMHIIIRPSKKGE